MKLDKKMQGFSLIELLVVVAIIGILAAVGTVGYSNYMNSTKQRVTIANAEAVLSGLKTLAAAKDTGAGCSNWTACRDDIVTDITKNPYIPKDNVTVFVVPKDNSGSASVTCSGTNVSTQAGKVYVLPAESNKGGNVTVQYCVANGTNVSLVTLGSFEFGD
jgi:type IV pilus assembly protein PilA